MHEFVRALLERKGVPSDLARRVATWYVQDIVKRLDVVHIQLLAKLAPLTVSSRKRVVHEELLATRPVVDGTRPVVDGQFHLLPRAQRARRPRRAVENRQAPLPDNRNSAARKGGHFVVSPSGRLEMQFIVL